MSGFLATAGNTSTMQPVMTELFSDIIDPIPTDDYRVWIYGIVLSLMIIWLLWDEC